MYYFRTLFSVRGLFIALYLFIGVAVNTAAPHIPTFQSGAATVAEAHGWVQYIASVFFWPLSFWQPTLSVGKWTGA
jgi:hypothetical protein